MATRPPHKGVRDGEAEKGGAVVPFQFQNILKFLRQNADNSGKVLGEKILKDFQGQACRLLSLTFALSKQN